MKVQCISILLLVEWLLLWRVVNGVHHGTLMYCSMSDKITNWNEITGSNSARAREETNCTIQIELGASCSECAQNERVKIQWTVHIPLLNGTIVGNPTSMQTGLRSCTQAGVCTNTITSLEIVPDTFLNQSRTASSGSRSSNNSTSLKYVDTFHFYYPCHEIGSQWIQAFVSTSLPSSITLVPPTLMMQYQTFINVIVTPSPSSLSTITTDWNQVKVWVIAGTIVGLLLLACFIASACIGVYHWKFSAKGINNGVLRTQLHQPTTSAHGLEETPCQCVTQNIPVRSKEGGKTNHSARFNMDANYLSRPISIHCKPVQHNRTTAGSLVQVEGDTLSRSFQSYESDIIDSNYTFSALSIAPTDHKYETFSNESLDNWETYPSMCAQHRTAEHYREGRLHTAYSERIRASHGNSSAPTTEIIRLPSSVYEVHSMDGYDMREPIPEHRQAHVTWYLNSSVDSISSIVFDHEDGICDYYTTKSTSSGDITYYEI